MSLREPRKTCQIGRRNGFQSMTFVKKPGQHFMPIVDDVLSVDEFAALKQLGMSFARGTVPSRISDRLKTLGYAAELMGSLIITDNGSARLATGH